MRIGVVSVLLSCVLGACGGAAIVVDATPAVDCVHDAAVDGSIDAAIDAAIDAPPVCSRVGFDSTPWAPTEQDVRDFVVFDRDGDGYVDVTTFSQFGRLGLLQGRANGVFAYVATPSGPSDLAIGFADVNNDQRLDAIFGGVAPSTMAVVLGNADGSFTGPTVTSPINAASYGAMQAKFIDVNGDNIVDLIDTRSQNSIAVVLGVGDGSFQSESVYPVGLGPSAIEVRDLNADGHPDVIVANANGNNLTIYLGSATGALSQRRDVDVGGTPLGIDARDIDGDGKVDILASNFSGNTISLLRGNGNGTFAARVDFPARDKPYGLAVADVDGDGLADVVVSNRDEGGISTLKGMPNGVFGAPQSIIIGPLPQRPQLRDVNQDGALDVVVPTDGLLAVLLNDRAGSFRNRPPQLPLFGYSRIDQARDFNRDGNVDLLLRGPSGAVVLGKADGTFGRPIAFVDANPEGDFQYFDVNRDGILDIVNQRVATDHAIYVFLGIGDGNFQRRRRFSPAEGMGAYTVGDFNDDTILDIAYIRGGTPITIDFLRGVGDGNFISVNSTIAWPFSVALEDLHAADVDGDGKVDVVAYDSASSQMVVLRNAGAFALLPPQLSALPEFHGLQLADVNGDGRADLVGLHADNLATAASLGTGLFAAPVDIADSAGIYSYDFQCQNFVGDSKIEIVALARATGSVAVFSQDSSGTFKRTEDIGLGARATSWTILDHNRDGKLDIIASMFTGYFTDPAYTVVYQRCLN